MNCPKCNFENPADSSFCSKCGTNLISIEGISVPHTETLETPTEELSRGSTFAGRYEVIEELGKGGMGRIYRVEDKKIKAEVALKLIKPEIAAEKKTIERFSNELKMARMISHRNVCRMFDLGEEKGTHYITMEYVPGEDLKSMIKMSKQLSVATTINIAKQVCEGLIEAHRLGVVHRDLKPSNVMIDKEGNVRIMDFGIARSIKAKGITDAGMIIGTPEYMSPEQVEGKEVEKRSDIYSLGVILYEMLTGKVPFEGDTPLSIAVKHKTEPAPDPRKANVQIPEDISRLILKCLEKDKGKRYQSADEVYTELSRIEKVIPTTDRIFPRVRIKKEKIEVIKLKKALIYGGAAVFLILLVLTGIYLISGRRKAIDSIAVLPLENLSGDPEQEYFADGMTEALIGELAQIKALQRVISRQSVMQYKGSRKPLPEIGRELNVNAILEGSILLIEQRVRITANLFEAKTEKNLWSQRYERDLRDVLSLQGEMAQTIAKEIKIAVTPEVQARLARARPVNPEAYQDYLRGRFYWNKRTEEGLLKAIKYFEQSIEKDPNCALLYAGLADSYIVLPLYSAFPAKEAAVKAQEAALKALEIDNMLSEAHTSLASFFWNYKWDWLTAEREFKRSIELNPNYGTAHHWFALLLMYLGRHEESIIEIKKAQELDPFSLIINANVGNILYHARRYDEAIEQYLKTLEMDPNFAELRWYLGLAYEQKRAYEEAIKEIQEAINLSRGLWRYKATLGHIYALSGKRAEAMKTIEELKVLLKRNQGSFYYMAKIFAALGENNQALDCLEKAYDVHEIWMKYLKIEPLSVSYTHLTLPTKRIV